MKADLRVRGPRQTCALNPFLTAEVPRCKCCPPLPVSRHGVGSFLLLLFLYSKRVPATEGPNIFFMKKLGLWKLNDLKEILPSSL